MYFLSLVFRQSSTTLIPLSASLNHTDSLFWVPQPIQDLSLPFSSSIPPFPVARTWPLHLLTESLLVIWSNIWSSEDFIGFLSEIPHLPQTFSQQTIPEDLLCIRHYVIGTGDTSRNSCVSLCDALVSSTYSSHLVITLFACPWICCRFSILPTRTTSSMSVRTVFGTSPTLGTK